MAKSATPPPGDESKEKKIADAQWLAGDTTKSSPKAKPKPRPAPAPPAATPSAKDEDHSYDLAGGDDELFSVDEGPAPPPPIPVPPARSKPAVIRDEWDPSEAPATREFVDEDPKVDQVWTRGAEWGTHLFWVGLTAGAVVLLAYKAVAAVQFLLAFFILAAGGVVLLVICYPIFITLERPVRITPEQAAKDYFAMLSYPWPFFPRMWLLLSNAGRTGPDFSSYSQFKSYWKKKLATLQGGKASLLNPLKFQVENFTSEKSVGATALKAKYTLKVFKGEPGPNRKEVASFLVSTGLVKGPDRMWYLNSGTLPNERKPAASQDWGNS